MAQRRHQRQTECLRSGAVGMRHAQASHGRAHGWGARCGWCALALGVVLGVAAPGAAEDSVGAASSVFNESGGPLHMTVVVPTVKASKDLGQAVTLRAGWTADVVSGASVAVVDAPAAKVDAISSATVTDTRHAFNGSVEVHDGLAALAVGYTHAFENDYLSNALNVSARTDLWDRDTTLQISYARAFDEVCDLAGSFDPVMKPRLDSSKGCFSDHKTRTEHDLASHTWQAAWTQALTPILSLQVSGSAQVNHGFQSNPYRAVRIGRTAAQEHHPIDRARYSLGAGLRLWIAALGGSLSTQARAYRDTWDISSLSGELGYDQTLVAQLRLRLRGRYYTQTAAAFYSDDYVLDPRGQYFTGDRELSPLQSVLAGPALLWTAPTDDRGHVLGVLSGFELTLKGDVLKTYFNHFHYDKAPVPNTFALIGTLELHGLF
ncbi:MAG TPA: DUF3570 domain-containing protein [Polyangiales bacterium]